MPRFAKPRAQAIRPRVSGPTWRRDTPVAPSKEPLGPITPLDGASLRRQQIKHSRDDKETLLGIPR